MKHLDPKSVWLFFLQGSLISIVFALVFSFLLIPIMVSTASSGSAIAILACGLFLLFTVGLSYFWAVLSYNNYKYELTEDGFKREKGVIFKKYTTIPYERIQNVDIYRGILARLLGLSDLQIQTAGLSFTGQYGAVSEGRLPGLSKQIAEELRDELVRRSTGRRN